MRKLPDGLLMETARVPLPNTVSNPRLLRRSSRTIFPLNRSIFRLRFTQPLHSPVAHLTLTLRRNLAEFRGPGVHHNFDDSDSGYDVDSDNSKSGKSFGIGGYKGRIIFLGDGTEILTDSDDTEMFDNSEEDKDLVSQVSKGSESEASETAEGAEKKGEGDESESKTSQPVTAEPASETQPDSKSGEAKTEAPKNK